jgi:hypothetical protein
MQDDVRCPPAIRAAPAPTPLAGAAQPLARRLAGGWLGLVARTLVMPPAGRDVASSDGSRVDPARTRTS